MPSGLDATELLVCYVDTQNAVPAVTDVVRSFDLNYSTSLRAYSELLICKMHKFGLGCI